DHASNDDRTGPVDRAAFGRNAVDGLVGMDGVVVPKNGAVLGRVGAHMPVHGAGESHSGDGADGGGLGRAAGFPVTAAGGRRKPEALAVIETQGYDSTAGFGVGIGVADDAAGGQRCLVERQADAFEIGDRHVDARLVGGGAPLDAADRVAFAYANLPQDFAVVVGIKGVDHARLLTCDQGPRAAGESHQNRGRGEVPVGGGIVGAVGLI